MSHSPIAVQRYDFPDEDITAVLRTVERILRQREFLTNGAECGAFEREFASYTGAKHAVSVSSGTAALEAILRCLNVEEGEVILPSNTFIASAAAVIRAGAHPVFVDSDDDMCASPDHIRAAISPKTRAIMVVHIGGLLSKSTTEILKQAEQAGVPVIEDAAHAHGSRLAGAHSGTIGVAGAFSFFSTKVMTTGEGGMIVTDDDSLAEQARVLRDHGKNGDDSLQVAVGYNWRMTEIQAVFGRLQLHRLDEFIARRTRLARIYIDSLARADGRARVVTPSADVRPNYYKLCVLTEAPAETVEQDLTRQFGLRMSGAVYRRPCHLQPALQPYVSPRAGSLLLCEHQAGHHICPPIYPSLRPEDAETIGNAILTVLNKGAH